MKKELLFDSHCGVEVGENEMYMGWSLLLLNICKLGPKRPCITKTNNKNAASVHPSSYSISRCSTVQE